jgi:predicted outer membrane repeat protein
MGRIAKTGLAVLSAAGSALTGCVPPPPPPPNIVTVTTTTDSMAADGLTSLREAFAIANANDVGDAIVLTAAATYDLTNCTDGALPHTSPAGVTVVGNGATIRQTCTDDGIMRSVQPASSLVVRAATLIGGPSSGASMLGAAINVRGALVLEAGVTVTGVDAGPNGTVIEGNAGGYAAEDITLRDSRVVDSVGTGIRLRDGGVRLAHATVSDLAGDGIRLNGTSTLLTERNSSIAGNSGWGVNAQGFGYSSMDIGETAVDGNARGGISCTGCLDFRAADSTVDGNGAGALPGSGGGIVLQAVMDDTADSPLVELYRTTVNGNRARRAGGGVFVGAAVSTEPTARWRRVLFVDMTVDSNATSGDDQPGGGVAVTAGNLEVYGTRITSNVAGGTTGSDGGGLYFRKAASDVVTQPYYLSSDSIVISGNRTNGRGGGAYVQTDGYVSVGGTLAGNVAGGDGGGMFSSAVRSPTTGTFFRGSFLDNTSGGRGGGAYLLGDAGVTFGSFRRNVATEGGGVYFGTIGPSVGASIEGSGFDANTASVRGGAIAAEDTTRLTMANTTVNANVAPRGGGLSIGINPLNDPETLSMSYVTLADNVAPTAAHVASYGRIETFASLMVLPRGGGSGCLVDPIDRAPLGYSFVSDTSCGVHPADTVSAGDLQLGPLTDYGFYGVARPPAPTSPVGGTVPAELCTVPYDQVGNARPLGAACEPGSVEIAETPTDGSAT